MGRPRPVLIYGCVMAALLVLTTSPYAAELIPGAALSWLRLAAALAGGVGGALFVQSKVTPMSDPRTNDDEPLVPQVVAELASRRRGEQA